MIPNYDEKIKIHYGVISINNIIQSWAEDSIPTYGPDFCPICGNETTEPTEQEANAAFYSRDLTSPDCYCKKCNRIFDYEEIQPEEPAGYVIDTEKLKAQSCLDNDVMILFSEFFTYCRPCSPCCPNAGDLETPTEENLGIPAYCFGPDFYYPEEKPNFDIFSVETKQRIYTAEKVETV